MSFELFDFKAAEAALVESAEITTKRAAIEQSKRLGLTMQAILLQNELRAAAITTSSMTDEEVTIWSAWLPTRYGDGLFARHSINRYSFDRVPEAVMNCWEQHKASGIFDSFEIWTPEKITQPDPILIGYIGDKKYLLARWGESDERLISFTEIKHELKKRWSKSISLGMLPGEFDAEDKKPQIWPDFGGGFLQFVTKAVIAIMTIIFALAAISENNGIRLSALIFVGGLAAYSLIQLTLTRVAHNKSPVLQAIKRHDALAAA